MKILIIEDDPSLSNTIKESITEYYETEQVFDGEEGLYRAEQGIYDAIILDIMLPVMNGYEVLEQLRQHGVETPVICLTAKDGIDDKIHGFKAGADDYLVKPFHREELILRIDAIVRRTMGKFRENTLYFKDLKLDTKNKIAYLADEILQLNGKQYAMLEYLILNKEVILTKEQIFDRLWGFESDTSHTIVEVYASYLRRNLKKYQYDRYIRTFRGLGYMFTDRVNE